MPKPDDYRHLNDADPLNVKIDIEDLVAMVEKMNYGTHRFLSALIRSRRKKFGLGDELSTGIEELLRRGMF